MWKMPDWAYMKDHVIPKAQELQQLVEVQESTRILVNIANGNKHYGSNMPQPEFAIVLPCDVDVQTSNC